MNIVLPDNPNPHRKRPLEYFFKNLFSESYPKPGIFGCWTEIVEKRQDAGMEIDGDESFWTICNYYNLTAPHLLKMFDKLKIDTVFSVHAVLGLDVPFKVLPFPHYVYNIGEGLPNRNILCSFVGELPNRTRRTLFTSYATKPGFYIKGKKDFHFNQSVLRQEQAVQDYKKVLARSRFSVCPRGFGPGTIRFWESLAYGAVPVLICDSCVLPPLWDWDETIIRINEGEFNRDPTALERKISKVTAEQETKMRKNCVAAFEHIYSGQTLRDYIRLSLHHLDSVATNTLPPYEYDPHQTEAEK